MRRLHRDRNRRLGSGAVLGQQRQQSREAGRVVVDVKLGDQLADIVDESNVVVMLGPVDATPDCRLFGFKRGWVVSGRAFGRRRRAGF